VLTDKLPEQREPVFAAYQSRRNLSLRVKVFLSFLEERLTHSMDWESRQDGL
jgi:DNA-binding transcriptional LysR family regulator